MACYPSMHEEDRQDDFRLRHPRFPECDDMSSVITWLLRIYYYKTQLLRMACRRGWLKF